VSIGALSRGRLDPDLELPLTLLVRFMFFLSRRPISGSNRHFLERRVSGLRSLAGLIASSQDPLLEKASARLLTLTPLNLKRVATEVSGLLAPILPPSPASDVVRTQRPPAPELLGAARRIRLILGPGIGIGDEIICLSLPGWLRTVAPEAEIHLLSTRPHLWSSVAGVSDSQSYANYADLVGALRGDGQPPFEVVFLVDFERPGFSASISREPTGLRYIELSIGARTLSVFDGRSRLLHELSVSDGTIDNYYRFAEFALKWLGTQASLETRLNVLSRSRCPIGGERQTVFVSPFTSKYDPSEAAWGQLLRALLTDELAKSIHLVFDSGPNLTTERFAARLASATRDSHSGVVCELASDDGSRTLSLGKALQQMQRARFTICADTFAAHAAPLAGCVTLVLAGHELENWRVPHAPVFYFDDSDAPKSIASGMRRVLAAAGLGVGPAPWLPPSARRLHETSLSLDTDPVQGYEACSQALREVLCELPDWPHDLQSLFADQTYRRLLPSLPQDVPRDHMGDFLAHVQRRFDDWRNTNLSKYLTLVATGARR
jgi:hypothetical protein